jgi:hypothetical protein
MYFTVKQQEDRWTSKDHVTFAETTRAKQIRILSKLPAHKLPALPSRPQDKPAPQETSCFLTSMILFKF